MLRLVKAKAPIRLQLYLEAKKMVGMTNYTSMFFNPSRRTAFDYFRQGQEARQQFEQHQQNLQVNQQLMDVRKQQMDHLTEMNPLLLQAKQGQITLQELQADAQNQAMEQQAKLNPLELQGAQLKLEQAQALAPIERRQQEAAAGLAEFKLSQEPERFQAGQDLVRAQIEQQEAGTRNYNQQISQRLSEIAEAKKAQEQAQAQRQILKADAAIDQYESMLKTNPAAAEQFKQQALSQFGITEDELDMPIIKAQANIIKQMQPGDYAPVEKMPGAVINKKTGQITINKDLQEQALNMRQKEGLLKGKDLAAVNDKVAALVKEPQKIVEAARDMRVLKLTDSPIAQRGAAFKIMKIFDPTSVVQPSEQGMVFYATGAAEKYKEQIQSLYDGKPMSARLMNELVELSENLANQATESSQKAVSSYLGVLSEESLAKKDYDNLMGMVPVLEPRPEQLNQQQLGQSTQTIQAPQAPQPQGAQISDAAKAALAKYGQPIQEPRQTSRNESIQTRIFRENRP